MSAWDVAGLTVAAVGGVLYGLGLLRLRAVPGRSVIALGRRLACGAGWAVLIVALGPPLTPLADWLFAAHMGQHELLMLAAPPLLVMGKPLGVLLWALPRPLRARAASALRRPVVRAAWRRLTAPVPIVLLHAAVLWLWHVPAAFEAALRYESLHALQHLSFFAAATLFWWALVEGGFGRLGYGVGVLFVFATALHSGALGALLTLAPFPLYPTHADRVARLGAEALGDQQLAGLLMWVPAGVILLIAALALFAAWLGQAERRTRSTATARLARPEGEP